MLTGGYTIDLDRLEITGPVGPVSVEPQVFDVIAVLLRNRERVVTEGGTARPGVGQPVRL